MAGIGADSPASTSSRNAFAWGSSVASKADSRELPTRVRRKKVAAGGAAMPSRSGAARAPQYVLPAHELAIIFADRALRRCEAGVGGEGALRPFPDVAKDSTARTRDDRSGLVELVADHSIGRGGEILPLRFGRKARARPACKRVGLEVADLRYRRGTIDFAATAEGEFGALFIPIERYRNPFALQPVPTFG